MSLSAVGVDVAHVHGDTGLAGNGCDDARPALGDADRRDAIVASGDLGDLEGEA